MGLFHWLKKRLSANGPCTVSFDDDSITCRRSGGLVESVKWSDLRAVVIKTTDTGPWVDDVFWVLAGRAGGCVVPSESRGMDQLLGRLQRLPGFDNEAVMDAMQSTENRDFLCWTKAEEG